MAKKKKPKPTPPLSLSIKFVVNRETGKMNLWPHTPPEKQTPEQVQLMLTISQWLAMGAGVPADIHTAKQDNALIVEP